VITLILSVQSLIDNTFQYARPEYNCVGYNTSKPITEGETAAIIEDRKRDEQTCKDQTQYQALRSIANSGILTLMALALFIVHWRWVGKLRDEK